MKLYVGNLSRESTEDDLRQVFGEFGSVSSVAIITDRDTGEPRGFAFVEMESRDSGQAAIDALAGRELHNMEMVVNEARPKVDRPRGGGGFGGGGRGGGRGGFGGGGGRGGGGRGGGHRGGGGRGGGRGGDRGGGGGGGRW